MTLSADVAVLPPPLGLDLHLRQHAHDLVDEFRVMIDPLLLGGGKRIFPDDSALRRLRLLEHQVTTTGALLATYAIDRG